MLCTQEVQAYADEQKLLFFEISAKTNTNIQDIFYDVGSCYPYDFCMGYLSESLPAMVARAIPKNADHTQKESVLNLQPEETSTACC
jgi:hypothetical protein